MSSPDEAAAATKADRLAAARERMANFKAKVPTASLHAHFHCGSCCEGQLDRASVVLPGNSLRPCRVVRGWGGVIVELSCVRLQRCQDSKLLLASLFECAITSCTFISVCS